MANLSQREQAYIKGPAKSLLSSERLVLNCMQRMSGIASFTCRLNQKIKHTKCKILDTRKTTPGFRYPEKWAVTIVVVTIKNGAI